MSEGKFTCRHCGAIYLPLHLPPHNCAGVQADLKDATRLFYNPGDRVEWFERSNLKSGAGSIPVRQSGVITRIIGGEVFIRVGNTLVQKNLSRLRRVSGGKTSQQPSTRI